MSGKRARARLTATVVAFGAALVLGGGGAAAATAAPAATTAEAAQSITQLAPMARPWYVTSYSNHALSRMAQRNITRDQVEAVVGSNQSRVEPGHAPNSYKITNWGISVVISEDGRVITVF